MRWQDMPNGTSKYQAYLASREWSEKKNAVKLRAVDSCERCTDPCENLIVHHLTYERIYEEPLADLLGVCKDCHSYLHCFSKYDPLYSFELSMELFQLRHALDNHYQRAWPFLEHSSQPSFGPVDLAALLIIAYKMKRDDPRVVDILEKIRELYPDYGSPQLPQDERTVCADREPDNG
jgi:hypothetical protein